MQWSVEMDASYADAAASGCPTMVAYDLTDDVMATGALLAEFAAVDSGTYVQHLEHSYGHRLPPLADHKWGGRR